MPRNPRATGREAKDIDGVTVSKSGGTLSGWDARRPKAKRQRPRRMGTYSFRKSENLRIKIYYHSRRDELIRKLGGKCERCRNVDKLVIRHYKQADWKPEDLSAHCRVARYWREHEAGVDLILLCLKCSGKDKKVRV